MGKSRHLADGGLLVAPLLLVCVVACGGDEGGAPPASPSASASKSSPAESPSPGDSEQGEEAEALATFRAYWDEVEKAYAKNSVGGADIRKVSAGPARLAIEQSVRSARENGQAVKGGPRTTKLAVTEADLDRDVPKVRLSGCLDVSEWVIYRKDTGDPVPQPDDRLTKYVVTALLEKWPDGWVVTKSEPHQDTQC